MKVPNKKEKKQKRDALMSPSAVSYIRRKATTVETRKAYFSSCRWDVSLSKMCHLFYVFCPDKLRPKETLSSPCVLLPRLPPPLFRFLFMLILFYGIFTSARPHARSCVCVRFHRPLHEAKTPTGLFYSHIAGLLSFSQGAKKALSSHASCVYTTHGATTNHPNTLSSFIHIQSPLLFIPLPSYSIKSSRSNKGTAFSVVPNGPGVNSITTCLGRSK